jgi:hypothetical protein
MTTPDAYGIPSWAIAILFWRKVLAVESKGIPRTGGALFSSPITNTAWPRNSQVERAAPLIEERSVL